jgi:pterin-4a-carbinolamine dehydratase
MVILSKEELHEKLRGWHGWWLAAGEIAKDYSFETEDEAKVFAAKVRALCAELDRHPVVSVEGTQVFLATHTSSEDGVTPKDLHLAGEIEKIAAPKPVLHAVAINR